MAIVSGSVVADDKSNYFLVGVLSVDETGFIATVGFGVQASFKSNLIARLSYDHYFAEFEDIKAINLTVGYSF